MSESARGEGGRVWVPRTAGDKRPVKQIPEAERFYFLEEWYPKYGNLVPRDIATRAIHKVVYEDGLGIDGQPMVYLDLTHIDRATLDRKLGGILEIYEKFVGDDPHDVPMKIFPGMHYTMGGMWVDFDQMTNIPGIFAAGECEYQYHGANRLGANSLLSCILRRIYAGPNALKYAKSLAAPEGDGGHAAELARQAEINTKLLKNEGTENPFKLWRELGQTMTEHATVIRYNKGLKQADEKIVELLDRYKNVNLSDRSQWANTSFAFARQLKNMLELSRSIVQGALLRDESRGAHYKPDFPERNDEKFLKTTKASFTGAAEGPRFEYEEVDTQFIKPRPRRYDAPSKLRETEPMAKQDCSAIRNQAPGQPRCSRGVGELRAGVAAGHERHLRDDGDCRQPGDRRRPRDHAGHLRLQLPGGDLRLLRDAHQRQGAHGLLGAGGQSGAADPHRAALEVSAGARPASGPVGSVRESEGGQGLGSDRRNL